MSTPAPALDASQLRALLDAAERADLQGRADESARLLSTARSMAPEHPAVLGACGVHALRKGEAAEARELLERALAADPENPVRLLNLATSLRALNDADAETRVLERCLTLDPLFFPALMQKGSLLERQGHAKQAARTYQRALNALRPGMQLPKSWQPLIEHAQRTVFASFNELDQFLRERMAETRARHSTAGQDRVDDCLGAIVGKNRIYAQQPTFTHFPRLPAIQFYNRADFPWLAPIEQASDDIRAELLALLKEARNEFSPYLTHASDEPLGQWKELNQSKRWSALFLCKDGERHEATIARCPQTVAALAAAPVISIPHRGPTALFSLLEPKTRIPPHTGTTNIRLTVHIPLIVPPNCGFRVGTQVREWQPGTALIFDDTIEHEAWNDSDEDRVILIFDIWNPLLTPAEQELMTVATAAIAEFYNG
ncbi:MAG TPA: aspartyl/asparaginyl beta-hydroxylase domain-containing protein [Steroidobacteraceae bacterium]|jgi:aspartate beta-hydroxylase|nr:aspartyl/asparaginyl beta-hydroxylase domain-containing protein [Steroidobacteraceae bacterium]